MADENLGSKKEPAAWQTRIWEAKRGLLRGRQESGKQKEACCVADRNLGSKKEPAEYLSWPFCHPEPTLPVWIATLAP
ncbi:MAG: hypothetical protein JWM68_672 [Verrucomicrobiales bacterium]|nr:hypothetical protein [Verrucomicrobiales bacterium]